MPEPIFPLDLKQLHDAKGYVTVALADENGYHGEITLQEHEADNEVIVCLKPIENIATGLPSEEITEGAALILRGLAHAIRSRFGDRAIVLTFTSGNHIVIPPQGEAAAADYARRTTRANDNRRRP